MDQATIEIERQKYQLTKDGIEKIVKAIENIKIEQHNMADNKDLCEILRVLTEEVKKPISVTLTLE